MVALPMAMAITLQTIITKATFGDQEMEAGARAKSGAIIEQKPDASFSGALGDLASPRKTCSLVVLLACRGRKAEHHKKVGEGQKRFGPPVEGIHIGQLFAEMQLGNNRSHDRDGHKQQGELKSPQG
jgi:hypothetical protein